MHFQWQDTAGACPVVVAVGNPGCGKTTASKAALASTGGWPQRFFSAFTDKVSSSSPVILVLVL
jgi:replication-associated recombination protein RarA